MVSLSHSHGELLQDTVSSPYKAGGADTLNKQAGSQMAVIFGVLYTSSHQYHYVLPCVVSICSEQEADFTRIMG